MLHTQVMNLLEWVSTKIKGKSNENRIYLISNFEVRKENHELYIKKAHEKLKEEDLNIDLIFGKKHRNEIRTAKYKVYSFLPLIVFFQFLRLGNLYFLSISMLQLIPEITDSKGMPTYLIPLVFIIVVAMIKEFFEDLQRHKSDNEENSKKTMVFEEGILKEKKWADVKDGDVVKIFSYEYFPADLIILNSSNKKGIVNIETKNVDGESNVKQKYCLPDVVKYFQDDKHAGYCQMELISESPNDNIFDYKGHMLLPPLQYKKDGGQVVHFYDAYKGGTVSGEDPTGGTKRKKTEKKRKINSSNNSINNSSNNSINNSSNNSINNSINNSSNNSSNDNSYHTDEENKEGGTPTWNDKGGNDYSNEDHLCSERTVVQATIDNVVLRGTSLVNTKWIYGLVINTGNRTKLMKNASTKSRQKWSRLEFVYGNHVIVLIICQVLISFIVAIAGVLWMRRKGYKLWYLNLGHQADSLKTFFITIGSMILLFGSFIPVDLLLIWEVVRLLQGYLINWDNDMYSTKSGRHALSKAGQLLEEMGNVTHIYSDKTGTLTQNIMQLQNIGLGNKGIYGFYDFSNIKENIRRKHGGGSHDSSDPFSPGSAKSVESRMSRMSGISAGEDLPTRNSGNLKISSEHGRGESSEFPPLTWSKTSVNPHKEKKNLMHRNSLASEHATADVYTEDDFERGENEFVFFNRILFVNKIYSIRNDVQDQVHFLLLVLSLCHSAMIRNIDIDEMEEVGGAANETAESAPVSAEPMVGPSVESKAGEELDSLAPSRAASSEGNLEKTKIFDRETMINYTYLTQPQPQYDASSPDELALISTALYLGCEFVNRPNLTRIEIELTSTFAQRFILGEKAYNDFLQKKGYYEDNFDACFPEVNSPMEGRRQPKLNDTTERGDANQGGDKRGGDKRGGDKRGGDKRGSGKRISHVEEGGGILHMSIPMKNIFGANKASPKEVIKSEGKKIKRVVVPILAYEILDVFAFDNVRKRMSLIIKNEKKEIYMLVKGADTSVLKLAAKNQEHIVDHVMYQLNAFATSGLRTLVLGYKHLTQEEFNKMYQEHVEARKRLEMRKDDDGSLGKFYDEAEDNLIIIGCTGVDDKLQDDVPQVIQDLRDAGITICVLTGDKLETAINIGHSINILNKETYNAVFTETDPTVLLEQMIIHEKNTNAANLLNVDHGTKWWNSVNWENLNLDLRSETILNFMKTNFYGSMKKSIVSSSNMYNLKNENSLPELAKQEKIFNSFLESSESFHNNCNDGEKGRNKDKVHYSQFSITITGEALDEIMKSKILKIKFYTLARSASTLIACRVTPKQKSLLVKENSAFNPRGTSLAIGDGANDVGMILMANVGVGIAGKEGLQAARSSDFTISEFKYLKKLLFVHGRESLRRNSFLVYFCIFRNVSFCLCSMVLNFWTGYSAIDAWNPWTKQIINIAFTSLPVIFFVALDKQLPHHILLKNPLLYETSPSTLWPLYSNKKIEFYTDKIKRIYRNIFHFCLIPFRLIPFFQKSTNKMKSWIGKRSKPEKYRSYGTHYLFVYLLFAIWLATVETIIMLHFATGQVDPIIKDHHNVDIDFHTFSQILYTHHVIAVNAVVVLLTNTWFVISHIVLWIEIIATFLFWFIVSNSKLFLDIIGADELHGTFEKAHSSGNFYLSMLVSLYVSLLPLILLMTYQFMRKPTMEQIVLEQLKLGKFEGLRKYEVKKLAYIDSKNSSHVFSHKGFAFAVEAKEAFWGLVQKAIYKIKIPLTKDETGSAKPRRKN
ncbi:P-type ATPase, putative [Plasmodium knowlesi strain H]|uniref:P-type ATPase, putative n=3 Tax=Plasmodium knowlesi TaxID=5850 RepID=A0A5K1TVC5_PLAKH|nr:P-type ATPase, putative [Plasmodium knowlesi strain H]OTN66013.1 putative p-type ATPase [Plasmodium knowlesi]CAA9987868.1 P-type ATPase, putative [Plasmodium knowlesi strain H]SBO22295.1 P-type ATPase, putative [Plasmodium knowlesi strain H]SBO28801.1 P-type ATPase, putative [Plasmodium knowlesi strain H]VVS77342.1 P-type ATPase, putative [Plasmodium knowlesi strain H]|eukprot:XP_002258867.1 P-type ATPase, putative [Plasmodium knowlesi strain H]